MGIRLKVFWRWFREHGVPLVTLVTLLSALVTVVIAFLGRDWMPEPYWGIFLFCLFGVLLMGLLLVDQIWFKPWLVRRGLAEPPKNATQPEQTVTGSVAPLPPEEDLPPVIIGQLLRLYFENEPLPPSHYQGLGALLDLYRTEPWLADPNLVVVKTHSPQGSLAATMKLLPLGAFEISADWVTLERIKTTLIAELIPRMRWWDRWRATQIPGTIRAKR